MGCIKGTICKEVDKIDKNLRPNVCMVVSPLLSDTLSKRYKEISCKKSVIPLKFPQLSK